MPAGREWRASDSTEDSQTAEDADDAGRREEGGSPVPHQENVTLAVELLKW